MEGRLQFGERTGIGQAFDRFDGSAVELDGEDQAAANDLAVDADRAGATRAMLARPMGAGQAELVAQEIDQIESRLHATFDRRAVDSETNRNRLVHAARAITAAQVRRSNAPAR